MNLKYSLIGLLLGTSALISGIGGTKSNLGEVIKDKEEIQHYERILEINDEKIRQDLEDILSPEEIVNHRNLIKSYNRNLNRHSLEFTFYFFLGVIGFGANSISLSYSIKNIREKIKPVQDTYGVYDKPISIESIEETEIEDSEYEDPFINPWDVEIPKIGGKER